MTIHAMSCSRRPRINEKISVKSAFICETSIIFAAVKNLLAILSAIVVFASCSDRAGGWRPASELRTAHELMLEQPDSALKVLIGFDFGDSTSRSVVNEYQILVAEALYKNDCAQTNAPAVIAATAYYDSVFEKHPKNSGLAFETARAHYYRAVGETEDDDIVAACADYLKAADIMEEAFPEIAKAARKGMMDDDSYCKIRFKGLTYTRLGDLFYANSCCKQSLHFYSKSLNTVKNAVDDSFLANLYMNIGHSYNLYEMADSALVYYKLALEKENTLGCVKNNIAKILYDKGLKDTAYHIMKCVLEQEPGSIMERKSNEITIGEMLFGDKMFDTAAYYLERSFDGGGRFIKLASSKMLAEIYDSLGCMSKSKFFSKYYSSNAGKELDRTVKSKSLLDSYNKYTTERNHVRQKRMNLLYVFIPSSIFVLVFAILMLLHKKNKRKHIDEISRKNGIINGLKVKTAELENKYSEISRIAKDYKGNDFESCLSEYMESEICMKIKGRVQPMKVNVKTVADFHDIILSDKEKLSLKNAASKYIPGFNDILSNNFGVKGDNALFCRLIILDLSVAEIAALTGTTYHAANKRINSIKKALKTEENVKDFLTNHLCNLYV